MLFIIASWQPTTFGLMFQERQVTDYTNMWCVQLVAVRRWYGAQVHLQQRLGGRLDVQPVWSQLLLRVSQRPVCLHTDDWVHVVH